jgi:hypothetical protein
VPQSAGGKDPGKLWIPEEIGHWHEDDPPCKNGTKQGTRQGQHGTRNLEKMDVPKTASAETVMQKWDKEQKPETAAMKQE